MTENDKEQKGFVLKDEKGDTAEKEAAATKARIPLPQIDFSTFVVSLNASALMHLGLMEDPVQGGKVKNLELGKQTIDILVMLEEKTRGNLSHDEEKLLKNILYDLRINYVKQSK
jgi:hypothetical protein